MFNLSWIKVSIFVKRRIKSNLEQWGKSTLWKNENLSRTLWDHRTWPLSRQGTVRVGSWCSCTAVATLGAVVHLLFAETKLKMKSAHTSHVVLTYVSHSNQRNGFGSHGCCCTSTIPTSPLLSTIVYALKQLKRDFPISNKYLIAA